MKKKILLSPLIILIIIIVAGVSLAGASLLIGTTRQGETNSLSVDLQRGLVGNWDSNGNAKDATMYANNGTVTGATLTTDRKGQANKAYAFDGSADNISVTDPAGGELDFGTGDFTIAFWVKSDEDKMYSILGKTDKYFATGTAGWHISAAASPAQLIFEIQDGTSRSNSGAFSIGRQFGWTHIAVKRVGTTFTKYVNGAQAGTSTNSVIGGDVNNNVPFVIGNISGGAADKTINGQIDDVRIYNRALTPTEVTALYQQYDPGIQVSDLQKGLVGQWRLDGNAKDATLYSNNGTVTGATLTTDRKGQLNKAYSFNGTSDFISTTEPFAYSTTSDFSVSVWANWDSVPTGAMAMVAIGQSSANYIYLHVRQNQVGWRVAKTGNTERRQRTTATYAANTWHNVVMTKVGNNDIKIYIDGVEDTTREAQASDSPPAVASTMYIGRVNTGDVTLYFQGFLDDVKTYNRALSATEVLELYQGY
ncbi:MAG: LamG domain-containing protein [Candidatus Levybacteria bacterium]|nr:LamG domain-containing protein [Candidatus Levybacteria bacterium]